MLTFVRLNQFYIIIIDISLLMNNVVVLTQVLTYNLIS